MTYAFARDGGIPFSYFFHYLDPNQIPTRIIILIVVLDILIIVPSILSASLYAAINSLGTAGTYLSYTLAIFLRLYQGSTFSPGPFSLGKWSKLINILSLIWLVICVISLSLPIFSMPPIEFTWEYYENILDSFNWTPVMLGGFVILSSTFWNLSIKEWFEGPVTIVSESLVVASDECSLDVESE